MSTVPPADHAERTRLSTELDRTLFVEAGAGSGKTTQLVERVVQMVATGVLADIDQLAAITFTEAAAAELRDRIRDELESRAEAAHEGSPEHTRLHHAVERIDEAAIATLHGFAFRLLADYPVEAGLPPGFEVADEIAALVAQREQWAAFIDDLFADESVEAVLKRALALGLTTRQLEEIDRAFADNWDRLEQVELPDHGLLAVETGALEAALAEAVDRAAVGPGDAASVTKTYQSLGPFLALLRAQTDPEDVLDLLQHEQPAWPSFGAAKKPEILVVKEAVEQARAVLVRVLADARLGALEPIVARIRRHTLAAAEQRRRDGQIRFHDLLVLTRRLLADHREVRAELAQRHRVLLIDEFQDTDPLQIEIALLLTLRDPATEIVRHRDQLDPAALVADEGRLFFVGDPKQSIYRFRRADIVVFEQAQQRFSHHGLVELSVNFRSVPSVLGWINATFATLIAGERADGRPAYVPLTPARDEVGDGPTITLVGGLTEARSAAALRETESDALARAIVDLHGEARHVLPRGAPSSRPVRFQDIAVLIPSRVALAELERALDRYEVPYRIESRSLVFGSDQVRELLAILQAVDDPADEVAVVAALRSPGFACSDRELARFRSAGGRWGYRRYVREVPDELQAELGPDDPVLRAMACLNELHDQRVWLPVNELVDLVVRRCRLVELTAAHRRPRDHWRRIRLVQDEARAFVESGGLALADFIAHIEQQSDEQASRVETVVAEADDDAVRVLTIHGSKGLEFPVVVMAGLGTEDRALFDRVFWADTGPEIALGAVSGARFETSGFGAVRQREVALDLEERNRLLYVAATRARDHLLVGLFHRNDRCAAARLAQACEGADGPTVRRITVEPVAEEGSGDGGHGGEPGDDAPLAEVHVLFPERDGDSTAGGGGSSGAALDLSAWRDERAALLERAHRAVRSPTSIATSGDDQPDDEPDARLDDQPGRGRAAVSDPPEPAGQGVLPGFSDPGPEPGAPRDGGPSTPAGGTEGEARRPWTPPVSGGGIGTAVGRAVHATLQVIDLDRPDDADLAALALHHAVDEGIADRAPIIERLARSALRSPSVQAARAGGRYWRELFVSAPIGPAGTLVEGYIDLLYETVAGELVVVDYKTDQGRDDEALAAASARYRLQGATYAAVLEVALGRPVTRCVFVFARSSGPAVEQTIEDVADAIADVHAALV